MASPPQPRSEQKPEPTIRENLDKIADRLAKRLDSDSVEIADLLDGTKVLTSVYVALTKGKDKEPDRPPGRTFADIKDELNGRATIAGGIIDDG